MKKSTPRYRNITFNKLKTIVNKLINYYEAKKNFTLSNYLYISSTIKKFVKKFLYFLEI